MSSPPPFTGSEGLPGKHIGPYKLLQKVGEGGFGVVYMAEQLQPIHRRVALKIIKPGMDTRQVIARFEAERQALAMMDHPNIAKVLDAGTTDDRSKLDAQARGGEGETGRGGEPDHQPPFGISPSPSLPLSPSHSSGRPYFVMELVQGVPITEYCDQCNFTTNERLELFITVCQAVQHAHQKGVIHRDLKPTNVLVAIQDGRPAPKIIDFGVAKAIGEQPLTEHTLTTAFAQMVGTPLYMSPEQAELSPLGVDTRSDIYSLGVLLYELVTSSTPFDKERLRTASYDEIRRIIRDEEPLRPSARLSTLAAHLATTVAEHRRTDSRRLLQTVRGELDWIVMKCLEKDRNRRYESVSAVAQDVERYLADEPVSACPPSQAYRLQKFLRRNKATVLASLAVFAALIVGILAASWHAMQATRERDRAISAEERAVTAEQRATVNLRRALVAVDRMLTRVGDEKLKNVPHVENVRGDLLEDAVKLYSQFLEETPADPRVRLETAMAQRRLAALHFHLGRNSQAQSHIEQSLALLRHDLSKAPADERLQLELARSQLLAGSILDQLEPIEEAVANLHQLGSHGKPNRDATIELAFALSRIGSRSMNRGHHVRAEQTYAEAEALFEHLLPRYEEDRELRRAYAKHLMHFGTFFGMSGDWNAEVAKLNHAIEIAESLISSEQEAENVHILATALLNRGWAKMQLTAVQSLHQAEGEPGERDYLESDKDFQEAVGYFRQLVRDYPAVPLYRERLAGALTNQIRPDLEQDVVTERVNEALAILERLVIDYPTVDQYRHMYGGALSNVAQILRAYGVELDRAEQLAREAIRQQTRVLQANPEDFKTNHYLLNHYVVLAEILVKQGAHPAEVVDSCSDGLRIGLRLQEAYPDNEFVAVSANKLQDFIRVAEREMAANDVADREQLDRQP
jgi:serine/threonine protein kinase